MSDIREQLLAAVNNDSLLETAYQLYSANDIDRSAVGKGLALLHNQNHVNAIAEFMALTQAGGGHKFFTIRHVLTDALPVIDAPVLNVMQCVKHLTDEAGKDMAAGTLFPPFTNYCQAKDDRPDAVLALVVARHEDFEGFISPAIIAGTRLDLPRYVDKAIELTTAQSISISANAILALGRIDYGDDVNLVAKAFVSLTLVVQGEYNDQLFSAVLEAAYALYLADKSKAQEISDLIAVILAQRGEFVLNCASQLFAFEKDTLPDSIIEHFLQAFEDTNPNNTGTLSHIDYGLEYLLEKGQADKVIKLLESLLIKNAADLSIEQFGRVCRRLLDNQDNILDKLLTRWLLSGIVRLGRCAADLINHSGREHILLSADLNQLQAVSNDIHLFLAKKACGWFFSKPLAAASFMLSLIGSAADNEVKAIAAILFNPLLINYPGCVKKHLQKLPEDSSEKVKQVVAELLMDLDGYHEGLNAAKSLKELQPSVSQREAFQREMNREMSASYKETQKGSFLADIVGKPSVLLYGNSSIHYIQHGSNGEKRRQEIPLNTISASIEVPSIAYLDPYGLDMALHGFKLEGCH